MNFYVMQVRAAVLALAVCLGGSALAWGGEAAAPDVPKLVEALKSDDPDERDKAYRTLAEAGEPVRADLEKALAGAENNPDLASRLRNLLKNIGQREMLAGFDAPKTIDLELAEGTLGEAMAKLKAAFGWDVKCNEAAAAKKLSVTLKGARFFEALEALRKAAGVTYRVNQNSLWGGDNNKKGELPLELVDKGEDDWLTAAAAGPFLILPMSVNYQEYRTKSIFPGQANQRNFSFQGVVLAEPGCAASAVAPGKCSFTDAKGKDFASAYGDNNRGFGGHGDGGRNGVFQFNDQFQISDELSGPVNWKCMLKVQVPLKMKSKRIESLADLKVPEKIDLPDGAILIHAPEASGDQYTLKFVLPANSANDLMNFHGGVFAGMGGANPKPPENQAGVFVLDEAGGVLQNHGMTGSGDGEKMEYTLTYPKKPAAVLIQWHSEKAERSYEVELKGLPVP